MFYKKKPAKAGGELPVTPELLELLRANATGESQTDEVPLPAELVRERQELKRMAEEDKTAKHGSQRIEEAINEFLENKDDIPLPPDMIRRREELAEYIRQKKGTTPPEGQSAAASEAGQDPARRIGPQNPDHPGVNRKPGGRNLP